MRTNFKLTPVALALATLAVASAGYAQEERVSVRVSNSHSGTVVYNNNTAVSKSRSDAVSNSIAVSGSPRVLGDIIVNSESAALVDTKQESVLNNVTNSVVDNTATVDGGSLNSSSGNIGVNVAAGDNNAQANDGAISAADAAFVFADAQSFGYQKSALNTTVNSSTANRATLSGALIGVRGNVGVNIVAGNSNVQANALAVSTGTGTQLAKAGSYTNQMAAGNSTQNLGTLRQETGTLVSINMSGRYAGIADQYGNQWLDNWGPCVGGTTTCPNGPQTHPTNGAVLGHTDLDSGVQGAQDRPQPRALSGLGAADLSGGGALSFNEAGDLALSGTFSQVNFVRVAHVNTAALGGGALGGAQGNIGVNIAAGTNNLQRNSLAVAVGLGRPSGPGPGPGPGE